MRGWGGVRGWYCVWNDDVGRGWFAQNQFDSQLFTTPLWFPLVKSCACVYLVGMVGMMKKRYCFFVGVAFKRMHFRNPSGQWIEGSGRLK